MRTAIIGMGRMGRRHLTVARDKQLDVVGICDQFPEALAAAGEEQQIAPERRFTDVFELFKSARPECVIVATHATSHCEYVCTAAESGARYILCEKPLAVSLAECDRMIDVCRRFACKLAVNHQMRFMDQYTITKGITDSPAFGGLTAITAVTGNFGLAMNGTHYFEMFRFLTGEPAVEATAWFDERVLPNPRGPQFQDRSGSVRLTTASGKRFFLDCSGDQGHGLQMTYAGRNGYITVDELTGSLRSTIRKSEFADLPTSRYGMPTDIRELTITPADSTGPTRSVLDSLLSDGDFPTAEQGRAAIAALVACYISNENGHVPIRIADAEQSRERVFPWA